MANDWRYIGYADWAIDELLHTEYDEDKLIDILDGCSEKTPPTFDAYEVLQCLTEKEALIVELILFDGRTYISVGRQVGLSKQRVHQIYNLALDKIKKNGVLDASP